LCAGTSEHGLLFSHHDPEGRHLQLDANPQHAPGSAAAAAAGLQRPGLGVSGYGRGGSRAVTGAAAAAAGPSAAELSNMLSSLNIASRPGAGAGAGVGASVDGSSRGGDASAAAGVAANEHQQQQEKQQRRDALQVEVQQLQYQLRRVTTDVATVGPRLPDGGSKVRSEVLSFFCKGPSLAAALRQQLALP
jgi:hypothetical protein